MAVETIRYIDQLSLAGMPDAAFQALHHRGTSMEKMREYCTSLKNGFREDDTNAEFRTRLEFALRLVKASPPRKQMDWYRVVADTLGKFPIRKSA